MLPTCDAIMTLEAILASILQPLSYPHHSTPFQYPTRSGHFARVFDQVILITNHAQTVFTVTVISPLPNVSIFGITVPISY